MVTNPRPSILAQLRQQARAERYRKAVISANQALWYNRYADALSQTA